MSIATPTRRSRGTQPFIPTPSKPSAGVVDLWDGDPIFTRPTRPSSDYPPEHGDDDENEFETRFYKAFTRHYQGSQARARAQPADRTYAIGDTIFVRGFFKETHVGVITALWDVRGKRAGDEATPFFQVHWFLKPRELPKTGAAREHRVGEIYYTPDQSAVLPLQSIIEPCVVDGSPLKEYTPRKRGDPDELFCDTIAVNGLHFQLHWPKHRNTSITASLRKPDQAQMIWNVKIKGAIPRRPSDRKAVSHPNRSTPKKTNTFRPNAKYSDSETETDSEASDPYEQMQDAESSGSEEDDSNTVASHSETSPLEEDELETDDESAGRARKRRRVTSSVATPTRKRQKGTRALPTPSSKAALATRRWTTKARRKGKLRISRPSTYETARADQEALMSLPKDPHLRAMHLLHVAARPDALPGRTQEFDDVLASVLSVLEEGTGGCIYISGVPGTGKTATVHAVVRQLQEMATNNETNPFTYVEINGLRLPEPSAAYAVLWEAISGHDPATEGHLKISAKEALKKLDRYFTGGRAGPAGGAFVVLMDELDQLVTAKQDVVYNFFNWPNLPNSRLVVIAVSNTHDLPERVMSAKVKSRLGMEKIQFHPYSRDQLMEIVNSRLRASREGLDIDFNVMHEDAVKYASARVAAVNGDARRVLDIARRAVETVYKPNGQSRVVKMPEVTAVIKAMQNSPNAVFVKECSFVERVILAALIKSVRRGGVNEVKWGDVAHQCFILFEQLRDDNAMTRPNSDRLLFALESLVSSKAVLGEVGAAAERKSVYERLMMMNMETGEVVRALEEVGGAKWASVLGA
ncbi:Origin recognition complex, subunit 1 [Tulasnella sp. 403]|nr:Origin recognition complex, subunit 1 [Tulasnella sp. 403]